MEIEQDYEAVEMKQPPTKTERNETNAEGHEPMEAQGKRLPPRPPLYVCHRCGTAIGRGSNGSDLRSLAIYCKDCAAKVLEVRERHALAAAKAGVRIVRVRRSRYRTGDGMLVETYTEYRGTFPTAVICGGEAIG